MRKHYPYAHDTNTNISLNQASKGIQRSRTIAKCSSTTNYMVEILLIYDGPLEILIGGRLHDVCSSFVFIVIIAIVGV